MERRSKSRIWELDFLRGICILLMLFDHTMFNFARMIPSIWRDKIAVGSLYSQIIEFARAYWALPLRNEFVWQLVVGIFFFISGICTAFSRSNVMRAIKLSAVAGLITVVTGAIDHFTGSSSYLVTAGVIHSFAVCSLIFTFISELASRSEVKICKVKLPLSSVILSIIAVIGVVLTVVAKSVEPSHSYFAFLFGFPSYGFRSADYIPVLPWLSVFLIGAVLSPVLYKKKESHLPALSGKFWNKPVSFIGRTSLWFYVFHQPIIYAILAVLGLVVYGELRIF